MPSRIAATAASTMCGGVWKSGSPISRWTMSRPVRSSAFARARTLNAVSVPSRSSAAARPGRRRHKRGRMNATPSRASCSSLANICRQILVAPGSSGSAPPKASIATQPS